MGAQASEERLVDRRAAAAGALAAAALTVLGGCAPNSGDGSDSGSGVSDALGSDALTATEEETEPLRVALRAAGCIDPYNVQTAAELQVVWQLFDPLTRYDFETGELIGLAAESWEVSEDACEFTFHLAEGATFHNGEAVTGIAFKRAWERIVNPQSAIASRYGASSNAYLLALVEGYDELAAGEAKGLSGLSCPDDATLVVSLTRPYADFPVVAAHPALSPVPYAASYDAAGFYAAPVGNGPFQLAEGTEWEAGADLELVRYEGYYGTPAAPETVRLVVADDAADAYWELQSGAVDVAEVPIGELSDAKKELGVSVDGRTLSEDERVVIGVEPAVSYLACNVLRDPMSSADVRRAASLAIDRDTICKSVYKRTRVAAGGLVPPGVHGYLEDVWAYCAHDADAADDLLQAEYPALAASEEDGETAESEAGEASARAVELELVYYADGGHDETVEFVVADLAQVGLMAEAEALGWEELQERLGSGEFDLALLSWTMDFPAMDNVLYPLLHSDSVGGSNRSGYANDELDALIDDARATVDDAERVVALQEAEALAAEDVPVIPLMYFGHVLAGAERISSLYCDPAGRIDLAAVEFA